MQYGVPTPYIKIRFHMIYPINMHGITLLYLLLFTSQNKKAIAVKYIIYNMNHRSI